MLSELVLCELRGLLHNRVALERPLSAREAVEAIQLYRRHPRWGLIGFPPTSRGLHNVLWEKASADDFAYRRLYDIRLALTMTQRGVREFATANVKDFQGLGFQKVWNPLLD